MECSTCETDASDALAPLLFFSSRYMSGKDDCEWPRKFNPGDQPLSVDIYRKVA